MWFNGMTAQEGASNINTLILVNLSNLNIRKKRGDEKGTDGTCWDNSYKLLFIITKLTFHKVMRYILWYFYK